jgi:iron(III) transport system substrate-binding protein
MLRHLTFTSLALTAALFMSGSAVENSLALSADKTPKIAPKAWDQIVAAAKREGTVIIYGPRQLGFRPILGDEFSKAYPDIQSRWVFNTGGDIGQRILAERRANRYIPDILIGGSSTAVRTLKPAGALAPLRPHLLLSEVLDESAWLDNRLWWADASEPNTTLTFTGYVNAIATFNTKLVKADQFRSYFDLLNPQWKGKIAGRDVRQTGPGSDGIRFIYHHPDLGPKFLERLFEEMDITLSLNQSQLMDWVAHGRYPISLFLPSADIMRAQGQGLPIAPIPMRQLKEGVSISSGAGSVSVMDRAPHPNAATVFLNWLLTREGQSGWQRAIALPSLRTDISKSELNASIVVEQGVKVIDVGTEKFILSEPEIRRVITKALEKAGR